MKVLLAIESCHGHYAQSQVIRSSWLLNRNVDYRFFLGGRDYNGKPKPDEVWLDCADSYEELPFKTQGLLGWALEKGYDYVFKCDTDTYVCVPRLLTSGFWEHDYTGYFERCKSCRPSATGHCQCLSGNGERFYSYASGGAGYWLSARAAAIVVGAKIIPDPLIADREEQSTRGEDLQVGWALGRNGIECHLDERYSLRHPGPLQQNSIITLHACRHLIHHPERMEMTHRAYVNSGGQ
jgi:hypothetical protein